MVSNPKRGSSSKGKDAARAATRCVGAQYVASLDPTVSGMLAEMPRVGAAMLFARVDGRGRVSLVRTGVVTRFESHHEDPFAGGGPAEGPAPSVSVETSAPVLTPPVYRERTEREKLTEPIPTVRVDAAGRPGSKPSLPPAPPLPLPPLRPLRSALPSDDSLAETRAYSPKAAPGPAREPRDPRWATTPSAAATLRQPVMPLDDEFEDEVAPPRPPPRRSEPVMTRPRTPVPLPSQSTRDGRDRRAGSYPVVRDAREGGAALARRRGER
jgi:hypothetical protein